MLADDRSMSKATSRLVARAPSTGPLLLRCACHGRHAGSHDTLSTDTSSCKHAFMMLTAHARVMQA